jgi:hypothetical protein
MAATQCRICFNNTDATIRMVVRPTDDSQLNNPAFMPPSCVCINMPLNIYDAQPDILSVMQQSVNAVSLINPILGLTLVNLINLLTPIIPPPGELLKL